MTKKAPATRGARTTHPSRDRAPTGRTRPRRWVLPGMLAAAAVAAIAIVAAGALARSPGAAASGASTSASAGSEVAPVLGRAGAPVELAEYGDFQCTSCDAFFGVVEPRIKATYIDTGKVRLVWHDFPWIGKESLDAANAARCAGDQGRFWDYHDVLYRGQGAENSGAFSKTRLESLGSTLGLDATRFDACVETGTHLAAVEADLGAATAHGFPGTPTFLIGGQRIVGAQPFAVFAQAIDAALGK